MHELILTEVESVGDFRLSVRFKDGFATIVDVRPYLRGPVFEPLHDPEYFDRAFLDPDLGTVAWPNGADLAPEALRGDMAQPVMAEATPHYAA